MEITFGRVKLKISFAFTVILALMLGCGDSLGFGVSFLCACIHEILHLLLFILFGAVPHSITLTAAGMCMDFGNNIPVSYFREAAASGIPAIFNTVLGFVFSMLYLNGSNAFLLPAAANTVLGIINLLPVRALDGGRALKCLLSSRFSADTANKVLRVTELLTLPFLFAVCIRALIINPQNISVPILCVYVCILIVGKKNRL